MKKWIALAVVMASFMSTDAMALGELIWKGGQGSGFVPDSTNITLNKRRTATALDTIPEGSGGFGLTGTQFPICVQTVTSTAASGFTHAKVVWPWRYKNGVKVNFLAKALRLTPSSTASIGVRIFYIDPTGRIDSTTVGGNQTGYTPLSIKLDKIIFVKVNSPSVTFTVDYW